MEWTKLSSLKSCIFNDVTDWRFISVNLYCRFFTSKDISTTDFMVGEKPGLRVCPFHLNTPWFMNSIQFLIEDF